MQIHLEKIYFRLASEADVPGIRKVIRSSVEEIAAKDYPPEVIRGWGIDSEKARFKQQAAIRDGKELTWVACAGDVIVGFSAFSPEAQELRAVYIMKAVQGTGVGAKLLELVEHKAIELKIFELTMHSSITAASFYERHGYAREGELVHTLASGVKMKVIAMRKSL
jgi:putative acetyltransferase